MKKLKFKSLTMRIWMTFTAIILIIICSISLIYLVAYSRINENNMVQDLKTAHEILLSSNNFDTPIRLDAMKNLRGSQNFILKKYAGGTTQIIDTNKNSGPPPGTNGTNNMTHPQQFNTVDIENWLTSFVKSGSISSAQHKEVYKNQTYIFIISSITSDTTGNSYLISYMPDLQDNSILYVMLGIGIVFIAIGFLTAKLVANYISKPLKELENFTVRIAHKDWKEPIKVKNEDEIGRLADSMNQMQRELKNADEEEKTFLQSISHDLKTPVMVIMTHAEAIIDGIYIDSPEKTAEIIRDEAVSLEKKIKELLYLNTLDYVLANNKETEKINLKEMIIHIVNRFEVINSKVEWNLQLEEASLKGNADKVQVALENILDNALRYAAEAIDITLKVKDSKVFIEIYNDGPNISSAHINHIFDNLYKDKTGNFGLGLAISKKIINFYNGEISAENRDKGVSFLIKFSI
jgi:two-component system, OmpR family, sensor histidine kinase CssS